MQLDITLAPEQQQKPTASSQQQSSSDEDAHKAGTPPEQLPRPAETLDPRTKQCQRSVVGTVGITKLIVSSGHCIRSFHSIPAAVIEEQIHHGKGPAAGLDMVRWMRAR